MKQLPVFKPMNLAPGARKPLMSLSGATVTDGVVLNFITTDIMLGIICKNLQ
jgi:hypothetical protein